MQKLKCGKNHAREVAIVFYRQLPQKAASSTLKWYRKVGIMSPYKDTGLIIVQKWWTTT